MKTLTPRKYRDLLDKVAADLRLGSGYKPACNRQGFDGSYEELQSLAAQEQATDDAESGIASLRQDAAIAADKAQRLEARIAGIAELRVCIRKLHGEIPPLEIHLNGFSAEALEKKVAECTELYVALASAPTSMYDMSHIHAAFDGVRIARQKAELAPKVIDAINARIANIRGEIAKYEDRLAELIALNTAAPKQEAA